MKDIIALGELLVDFTRIGLSDAGMRIFEQNPGGAPANMLVAATNLGMETGLIGKIGNDMHGLFLKQVLEEKGVDTGNVIVSDEVFTTLAFVDVQPDGARAFSFARKPGADTCLEPAEVNRDEIRQSRVFHFGSLSLTHEPARAATLAALACAKEAGVVISFDPNYRAPLWGSRSDVAAMIRQVLPYVQILKCSDEETGLLTGEDDPEKAAQQLCEQGIPLVVVTMGRQGALVRTAAGAATAAPLDFGAVDTTGAGDAFMGGLLARFVQAGRPPEDVSLAEAEQFIRYANVVASLCVQKRGGIVSMPSKQEVDAHFHQ
ncbi:carbohydrate kinase [Ruminococcaceae bacterium OttesenSCG-928-D13]|nr:carbohydrate kinase [Ruminococcaceae bacterium OttesenSCG-928-D13]